MDPQKGWCHADNACGKGCHLFVGWPQLRLSGGEMAGHGNALEALQRRSCCRSWDACWNHAHLLRSFSGDSRRQKDGVDTIWSQIYQCMECFRTMRPFSLSTMDTGDTGRWKVFQPTGGRMLHCWRMLLQVPWWFGLATQQVVTEKAVSFG